MRILVLAMVGAFFCEALPQDKRTSGGQVPGSAIIIQQPRVQDELKLTVAQRQAVAELPQKIRKQFDADFEAMRKLQDADRRAKQEEIRSRSKAAYPIAMAKILKQEQQVRFRQILLQHFGVMAFEEQDVILALELSEGQKRSIHEIALERGKWTRLEQVEAAEKLLTDGQKVRWRELIGRPFEFEANGEVAVVAADRLRVDPKHTVGSREWVDACIEAWKPSPHETRITGIGWATQILEAMRLAKEHHRPVFLFNYSGRIEHNRC